MPTWLPWVALLAVIVLYAVWLLRAGRRPRVSHRRRQAARHRDTRDLGGRVPSWAAAAIGLAALVPVTLVANYACGMAMEYAPRRPTVPTLTTPNRDVGTPWRGQGRASEDPRRVKGLPPPAMTLTPLGATVQRTLPARREPFCEQNEKPKEQSMRLFKKGTVLQPTLGKPTGTALPGGWAAS